MTFIAGGYTATIAGLNLAQIEDGIELEHVPFYEDIRGDNLGDSLQDGVYRGGDCYMNLTLLEFDAAGAQAAFWPYAAVWGRAGIIGVLQTSLALQIVLTRNPVGTTATPVNVTAAKAIIPKNYPLKLLFAPRNRRVPLRLQLLPYESGGQNVWFVTA
jgi:hypothetical protein